MEYYIDYEQTTGKILGYLTDATVNQKKGEVIEVNLNTYNTAMAFNKIIIDGENITFEKVDFRTPEEIEEQRKRDILSQIDILEAKTYRPLREMQVGTEEEMLQASIILGDLNEQIKALRSQL